jgi:hypothetical protein
MSVARNWIFTWNAPKSASEIHQVSVLKQAMLRIESILPHFKYIIYQWELVSNHHLQGYFQLKKKSRLVTLKRLFHSDVVHFEVARGTPQSNKDYCTKSDSAYTKVLSSPFEYGTFTTSGQRSDLQSAVSVAIDQGMNAVATQLPSTFVRYHRGLQALRSQRLLADAPMMRPLVVNVFFGDPGSGKSFDAYHLAEQADSYYVLPTVQDGKLWFDGYDGEKVLLIEDYDGSIPFDSFKRLLDVYKMMTPVKGSHTVPAFEAIFITSNTPPWTWYPDNYPDPRSHLPFDCWQIRGSITDGAPVPSPLERRIHNIIEYRGTYPDSTKTFIKSSE